jgi:beta-lactamase superfamily II metal-dependent hydrolase
VSDFFEIDFLDVESPKSGDAIPLRYRLNEHVRIHVVDGGFQDTGQKVVDHIRKYYSNPKFIDHVVATHPDGDHAGGLRTVLEEFDVGQLWMLRPWLYADELIGRFTNYTSVENLQKRLKEIYPNLAALEEIAQKKKIPIVEPFQGAAIGSFRVVAPTKTRYLDLVVASERTPESVEEAQKTLVEEAKGLLRKAAAAAVAMVKKLWGEETFSSEETSAENEMSVVQYAELCDVRILLTADVGRGGLTEAADYVEAMGITLPGIDRFQVPHHGSRRNVSTETLDRWLGTRLPSQLPKGSEKFTAIVSSAKKDADHPRKAVVRAMMHRGAKVLATEGEDVRTSRNAPAREGWVAATPMEYPESEEE